jgi:hypothetical protein
MHKKNFLAVAGLFAMVVAGAGFSSQLQSV